jgi:putative membrane protein
MKIKQWMYAPLLVIGSLAWTACDDDDDDKSLAAQDRDFVQKASLGNRAEIELGALASAKGNDEAVRMFGQKMVTDHQQAYDELEDIADDFSNADFRTSLDEEHQAIRDQLMNLSGYAFDSAYMQSQITDHQKTVALFESETTNGSEARLKAYAGKYLPHIREHLAMADSIRNVIVMKYGQ